MVGGEDNNGLLSDFLPAVAVVLLAIGNIPVDALSPKNLPPWHPVNISRDKDGLEETGKRGR